MSEHRAPARPPTDPGGVAVLACVAARTYLGVLVGLLTWTVLPLVAGWQSSMIMSDSMAPAIRAGDVVVAQPRTDARPGQVVVADDPDHAGRTRTHRLDLVRPDGMLVLRGDANAEADSSPVTRSDLHGIARLRVPYVALPAVWLRTEREVAAGGWLLVTILAILLAPSGGARRPSRRAGAPRPADPLGGRSAPAHRQPATRSAAGPPAMLGIAVISTAVLVVGGAGGGETHAAFASSTSSDASFAAAASYCSAPGSARLTADADDWVDEAAPATPQGGAGPLSVMSSAAANRRSLVGFPLPAMPAGCQVTAATLTLTTQTGTAGRTIEVSAARGPWTEGGVTWNNMPGMFANLSATAPSVTSGPLSVDLTALVARMYSADVNFGFFVHDAVEGEKAEQAYASRETRGGDPTLVVTFG